MIVYLVQLLCPQRHCIIAAAFEIQDTGTYAEVSQAVRAGLEKAVASIKSRMAELKLDPWCGVCHSRALEFQCERTKFESLTAAMPILKIAEASNLATRARIIGGN